LVNHINIFFLDDIILYSIFKILLKFQPIDIFGLVSHALVQQFAGFFECFNDQLGR